MPDPVNAIVETDDSRKKTLWAKITAHQHACMTGARFSLEVGLINDDHKHVRNGIDNALVSHGALVKLLIDKGIITELEYCEALSEMWEIEQARYEKDLSDHFKKSVKLV